MSHHLSYPFPDIDLPSVRKDFPQAFRVEAATWPGWYLLIFRILCKGLAAQSKAEAIGQNKISSANQRPGFQMIFFSFWSGLIYSYELCVYGSKVMIVVEYSVHEQHMNPFICPFPLEKDWMFQSSQDTEWVKLQGQKCDCWGWGAIERRGGGKGRGQVRRGVGVMKKLCDFPRVHQYW